MTTQTTTTRPVRVFGIGAVVSALCLVATLYLTSAPHSAFPLVPSFATFAIFALLVAFCGVLKYFALRAAQGRDFVHWPSVIANALAAPVVGAISAIYLWSVVLV
jgi:hypothetical protein